VTNNGKSGVITNNGKSGVITNNLVETTGDTSEPTVEELLIIIEKMKITEKTHIQEYGNIKEAAEAAAAAANDDISAKNVELADTLLVIMDKDGVISDKDAEIQQLRDAAAARANAGRPTVDPRLKTLMDLCKVPGMDIAMAGGDFNAANVKMTVAEKIAMYEIVFATKTEYLALPAAVQLRLGRVAQMRALQCADKAALAALLPDGIVVTKKTTKSQLQVILPIYLVVNAARAEAAAAATAA
jgi:hypothetical protein